MSLIAKFAARKAGTPLPEATTTVNAPVAAAPAPAVVLEPTVETNVTPAAPAPAKRAYTRKAAPIPDAALETGKPIPESAKPIAPPIVQRAVTISNPLALLTGDVSADTDSVLEMILAKAEEGAGSFDGPFPLVKLQKGNSGGTWVFGGNVDGEAAAILPVANRPFTAQFLGYRIYGVAWETSKQGHDSNGGDENKAKPIWKVQIAAADKNMVADAINAGEVYQYTKGAEKGEKFDGLGHFRPGVEFLFMKKGIVFAVRLPDHHTSTVRALESLGGIMRGVGGMRSIPLIVTPYTTDEKGAVPWKCHSLRFEVGMTAEGKACAEEFASVRQDMLADPEFSATFAEWNKTEVDDDAAAALKEIASMKKGR